MSSFIRIGDNFFNSDTVRRIETHKIETYRGSNEYTYELVISFKDDDDGFDQRRFEYKTKSQLTAVTNNIAWQLGV